MHLRHVGRLIPQFGHREPAQLSTDKEMDRAGPGRTGQDRAPSAPPGIGSEDRAKGLVKAQSFINLHDVYHGWHAWFIDISLLGFQCSSGSVLCLFWDAIVKVERRIIPA
jgi:hypothetical protein